MASPKLEPVWICTVCGEQFGMRECGMATWHTGICDICGDHTGVTSPRDFGYLMPGGWEPLMRSTLRKRNSHDA